MMHFSEKSSFWGANAVVGTVHSAGALAAALKLPRGAVDFLELRVDAFAENCVGLDELEAAAGALNAPLIVTVRHPGEGGANRLSLAQRRLLFRRFLPLATLIDVELRSAESLAEIRQEAKDRGVGIILSHHDFKTTPPMERLLELFQAARLAGCDVFKLAAVARNVEALARLLRWMAAPKRRGGRTPALAVMGMGEFGKVSRLALGRAGSVLNYGYLDAPQVSGQWPAEVLKQRLLELA